jgi:hypothetical protein
MAYDSETNRISVDKDSDFMADSGAFFINTLKRMAEETNAPSSLRNDWKVIEGWLGCAGRELTNDDSEKIGKAWRAYLAVGVAPSDKLQPVFTSFSNQCQQEGLAHVAKKPPTEVMDVFDRLLATETEIKVKRARDFDNVRKRFKAVLQNNPRKTKLRGRFESLSRNKRILIGITVAWAAWVISRTSGDYEILGVYLDNWEEDMFLVNLLLPPIVIWISFSLYKWINRADK